MAFDPQWVAMYVMVGSSLITSVYTLLKNNRETKKDITDETTHVILTAKAWGAFEEKVANIDLAIRDSDHGLHAIKREVSGVRSNCAAVTGGFKEKLASQEKRINGHDARIEKLSDGRN